MNPQSQIRQKLVGGIINGAFPPGIKLPSSRKLSEQLDVSRNIVVAAYEKQLAPVAEILGANLRRPS